MLLVLFTGTPVGESIGFGTAVDVQDLSSLKDASRAAVAGCDGRAGCNATPFVIVNDQGVPVITITQEMQVQLGKGVSSQQAVLLLANQLVAALDLEYAAEPQFQAGCKERPLGPAGRGRHSFTAVVYRSTN